MAAFRNLLMGSITVLAPFCEVTRGNHNEAATFFNAMAFPVPVVNASEDAVDAPGFRVAVSSREVLIFQHWGQRSVSGPEMPRVLRREVADKVSGKV